MDSLKKEIVNHFKADSVFIYTKKLKEEIYFPELSGPIILIYNATTRILDFKSLPTDYYQRLDNSIEIEDSLTQEAEPIADILLKTCDLSEFNDLIIEFIKKDKYGDSAYRFICHYNHLLIEDHMKSPAP